MNIESAQFTDEDEKTIKSVINGKTMFVPVCDGNRHYEAIQEWVSKGNSIEGYEA